MSVGYALATPGLRIITRRILFPSLCDLDKNPSPTFDPVRWLTNYEAGGGGWIERDDEILVVRLKEGSPIYVGTKLSPKDMEG